MSDLAPEVIEPGSPDPAADPGLGGGEPTVVSYDWADESVQTRAREAIERAEKWGDPTSVDQALEIQKALQTDEGVTQLFIQAGKALGIGLDRIDALFGTGAPAAPAEDTGPGWEPDHIPTAAEIQTYVEKQLETRLAQAQTQTSQQLATQQAEAVARTTVNSTMEALGVKDPTEAQAILRIADNYVRQGDFDPGRITAAIRKGYADYERLVTARATAYIEKKRTQTDTLPGSTSGGAPGGTDLPEPQNVAEARARVRKRLSFGRD